jgi:hypothetical protein
MAPGVENSRILLKTDTDEVSSKNRYEQKSTLRAEID